MRAPSYDYVRRSYHVDPVVGQRVRHTETGELGTIAPERLSLAHYVMVNFDDGRNGGHPLPCHPTSLDYNPEEDAPCLDR